MKHMCASLLKFGKLKYYKLMIYNQKMINYKYLVLEESYVCMVKCSHISNIRIHGDLSISIAVIIIAVTLLIQNVYKKKANVSNGEKKNPPTPRRALPIIILDDKYT